MTSAAAKPAPAPEMPAGEMKVPPTPTEVETLAAEYQRLEKEIAAIDKKAAEEKLPKVTRLNELWDLLVARARKFGSQHEKKSKLLYGLTLEVMGTFSSSSSIDAAAVETFRLALVKAKQSRVLRTIFEKATRWILRPEAGAFLRAENDAGKFPDELFVLYARCSVPGKGSERLVVRPKS